MIMMISSSRWEIIMETSPSNRSIGLKTGKGKINRCGGENVELQDTR